MKQYQLEVVWNREFNFRPFGNSHKTLKDTITAYNSALNMGDGACIKKARILDENYKVVYAYGQRVK